MTSNSTYLNASKTFSRIINQTKFEDLDHGLIERIKIRIADSIGVTVAGAKGVGIDLVSNLYKEQGGREEATVYNDGSRIPAANAAFINSMQMRSNDFEPCHANDGSEKGLPAHITCSLFPAIFAIGERENSNGKEILTAIASGEDLGVRLSSAISFTTNGKFDSNGTVNAIAATAGVAKLLNLDEEKIHNSLGIALNTLSGPMASTMEHSWLFKFPNANSAKNAIFSADMARHGFPGLEDPILGENCFIDLYADNPKIDNLFKDLGKVRYGEVIIKPYSSCCATHHSIKAALLATQGKSFKPEEVKEIRVHMLGSKVSIVGDIWKPGENSQPFASFSVQATVCNAVLHGGVYPQHQTPDELASDDFQRMLTKYTQIPDLKETDEFIAAVEIELTDGTILTGKCDDIRPGNMIDRDPLSIEDIRKKFNNNLTFDNRFTQKQADEIWELCMQFEQLNSMRLLAEKLVPAEVQSV